VNPAFSSLCAGGRRPRAGRLIAALLAMIILAALIALAGTKLDPGVVGRALEHIKLGWVLVAAVLMALAFWARAESWFAVIGAALCGKADARRLNRGTVFRALVIGMAGSAVLPGRLGEGARAWIVARRLGEPSRSFAVVLGTVVSQTFLNLLALGILAVVAVLDSALAKARVEAIGVAVVLPAALIALIFAGPPLLRRLTRIRSTRVRRAASWILKQLVRGREGLAVFRSARPALHATTSQLAAWGLQLVACYVTMLAFGLPGRDNFAAAAAVLLAVNLTAIVPLTPSNVGVFQAACIAVLHPFGVDASRALAYGLVLQAVEIFDALLLGGPALVHEGLRFNELHDRADPRMGQPGIDNPHPGLAPRARN
jgi:phosphatidyl-myo-inositol alpha-mannosyltransferase